MAVNVSLPLSSSELFEENDNDLQYSVDLCRENLKILVSPGSESSGVSSLDAEEAKKLANEQLSTPPIVAPEATLVQNQLEQHQQEQQEQQEQPLPVKSDKDSLENVKIMYNGRDILDICSNIKNSWNVRYTYLPENNFQMYLANRSQYHRLGESYNTKEYSLDLCRRCYFQYPVKFQEDASKDTDDVMPLVTIFPDNNRLTLKIASNSHRTNAIINHLKQPPTNHGNTYANLNHSNFKPATPNSFYNINNNINNAVASVGYNNGMGNGGMGHSGSGSTTPKPFQNMNRPNFNQSGNNFNNNKMPYKMYSHF